MATGSFTADADFRGQASGSLTANAVIREARTSSFTANAVIRKLIFSDDFSRTVAADWGRQYVHRYGFPDGHAASVDGSAGVVDHTNSQPYFDPRGYGTPRSGYIRFDFWVPADTT